MESQATLLTVDQAQLIEILAQLRMAIRKLSGAARPLHDSLRSVPLGTGNGRMSMVVDRAQLQEGAETLEEAIYQLSMAAHSLHNLLLAAARRA